MRRVELAKYKDALQAHGARLTRELREKTESQEQWQWQWWTAPEGLRLELEQDHPRSFFGQRSSEDQPMSVSIVDLSILWIPSSRIAIQLITPIPESPGGEPGEDHSAAEPVREAINEYATGKLVNSQWKSSTELWVTPVCEDMASFVENLNGLRDQWHQLIFKKPVQYVTGETVLADIATNFPLFGDTLITDIKLLVQLTGIVVGLTSGQPLLANACLKSLVHDVMLGLVSAVIRDVTKNTLEPDGTRAPDPETSQAGPPRISGNTDEPVEEAAKKIRESFPPPGKRHAKGM